MVADSTQCPAFMEAAERGCADGIHGQGRRRTGTGRSRDREGSRQGQDQGRRTADRDADGRPGQEARLPGVRLLPGPGGRPGGAAEGAGRPLAARRPALEDTGGSRRQGRGRRAGAGAGRRRSGRRGQDYGPAGPDTTGRTRQPPDHARAGWGDAPDGRAEHRSGLRGLRRTRQRHEQQSRDRLAAGERLRVDDAVPLSGPPGSRSGRAGARPRRGLRVAPGATSATAAFSSRAWTSRVSTCPSTWS